MLNTASNNDMSCRGRNHEYRVRANEVPLLELLELLKGFMTKVSQDAKVPSRLTDFESRAYIHRHSLM